MAVDPDDLLIFKRHGTDENELQVPSQEKLLSAPKPEPEAKGSGKQETGATEQQAQKTEEKPKAEQQQSSTYKSIQPEAYEENPEPEPKSISRSGRDNIAAAKGLKCLNHQWRNAYAVCNLCRRPFCYADLITYSKNFYCLEDIDRASGGMVVKYSVGVMTVFAGAVLVLNALILTAFTSANMQYFLRTLNSHVTAAKLPALQASTIVGNLGSLIGILASTAYAYPFLFMDISIAFLLLISGMAVIFGSKKAFYLGILVAVLALLSFSYEYLTAGVEYTLVVAAIAFADIAVLAYSRMSSITFATEKDESRMYIEWPKLETF